MYPYLGDFATGSTIFFPFATYNSSGASVTITGLAVSDIEVYKGASMTQRSSDSGYALVDTDGIDIDGVMGIHGFTIDTSDNSDASFYASGNDYTVVVSTITADGQPVSFIAGRFSLENRAANVVKWAGTAVATPTTAGVPEVDVTYINGNANAAIRQALAAGTITPGTVYNDGGTYAASTTVFYSDDITTSVADHWIGRRIIFTSGTLIGQATAITDYAFTAGLYGTFTVAALTSAPADNVTFIVV